MTNSICNTLNNWDQWANQQGNEYFCTDEKAIVHVWNNGPTITLASDSLKFGKTCIRYAVRSDDRNNKCDWLNWIANNHQYKLANIIQAIEALTFDPKDYNGIEVYDGVKIFKEIEQAKDVVTPWGLEARKEASKKKPIKQIEVDGYHGILKIDDQVTFLGAGDGGSNVTFRMGDDVQVASYNLHYYGQITAIKEKYIETFGCPNGLIRNTFSNILGRNKSQNKLDRDANWYD